MTTGIDNPHYPRINSFDAAKNPATTIESRATQFCNDLVRGVLSDFTTEEQNDIIRGFINGVLSSRYMQILNFELDAASLRERTESLLKDIKSI